MRVTITWSVEEYQYSGPSSASGLSEMLTASQAELGGEALHHRQQVDEAVGGLEHDHAVGLEVLHVERHRLARDRCIGIESPEKASMPSTS